MAAKRSTKTKETPPKRETFEARVAGIVSDELGVDDEEITPDADLVKDLGADSLDIVEIVIACEVEFGIEISDDEGEENFTTFEKMLNFLRRKTGNEKKLTAEA